MAERFNLGKVLVTLEGEHDSTRSYDKYCEVTSGGSSYVSKKAVPIGTPITDTAFWQKRASKGADGIDGNDGLDAYQPFKGWYADTTELNSSFGTPQVGDYAYVKGATASDPVAIYHCVTAGTWADSGRTFNPSNNQEFASGQSLNTVHIVDGLNSSSTTDVLSAKQGKVLDEKVAALGPKIDEIDEQINGTEGRTLVQPTASDYIDGSISSSAKLQPTTDNYHLLYDVTELRGYTISASNLPSTKRWAFISGISVGTSSTQYVLCSNCSIESTDISNVTVPQDAVYLYILCGAKATAVLPSLSSSWEIASSSGIDGRVQTLESSVSEAQGDITALQGSVGTLESGVSALQTNVGDKMDVSLTITLAWNYYWENSGGKFALSSHTGSRYAEAIALSDYVGSLLEVKMVDYSANSSSRLSGIGDSEGNIITSIAENEVTFSRIIKEGDYLYISCHNGCSPTAVVKDYATGMVKDVLNLQKGNEQLQRIPDVKTINLSFSASNASINIENTESMMCAFTRSLSTRIYGDNVGRIYINIPAAEFESGSMGVYIPWESQKVARFFFYYGDESNYRCHTSYADESVTLGEIYYIQGHTFQRFNFPQCSKVQIRVEVDSNADDTSWEIFLSNKAILNDHLPVAPLCIMYDGGSWEGSVIDNEETISLWQLHHKYNIPYGIGLVPGATPENAEVLADLESGFAEVIYRSADVEEYYGGSDADVVAALNNGWISLGTSSKMLVLPKHKLDKQMYRCYNLAGAEIVRTGGCNGIRGTMSSKFGDAKLFTLPSARLGGQGTDEPILKFPNIVWEHGVGIPPQGYTGDMYVDTTGVNTPILFQRLHAMMESGDVVCLRPSDWVAYCLAH